jgi:hypothetical protein
MVTFPVVKRTELSESDDPALAALASAVARGVDP